MKTIKSITNWMKTHKPIDNRTIIIFALLVWIILPYFYWSTIGLMGFVSYPHTIDSTTVMTNTGQKIGHAYAQGMTKIYEIGYKLGSQAYPHNILIAKIIIYSLYLITIIILIGFVVHIINQIIYAHTINSLDTSRNRIHDKMNKEIITTQKNKNIMFATYMILVLISTISFVAFIFVPERIAMTNASYTYEKIFFTTGILSLGLATFALITKRYLDTKILILQEHDDKI